MTMQRIPPETIHHLCNLSDDEIMRVEPIQLRNLLLLAVQQTMGDLRSLGVNIDLLEREGKGRLLHSRINQLHSLNDRLRHLK